MAGSGLPSCRIGGWPCDFDLFKREAMPNGRAFEQDMRSSRELRSGDRRLSLYRREECKKNLRWLREAHGAALERAANLADRRAHGTERHPQWR